jgi:hypothetical protein
LEIIDMTTPAPESARPSEWTLEQVTDHAQRYGLSLPDSMLPRLHELALKAASAGRGMPRQPSKAHEPAFGFRLPLE